MRQVLYQLSYAASRSCSHLPVDPLELADAPDGDGPRVEEGHVLRVLVALDGRKVAPADPGDVEVEDAVLEVLLDGLEGRGESSLPLG